MSSEIIDRIYECAFEPDNWPGVLDSLAEIADGRGGVLFAARDKVLTWTASTSLSETFRSYLVDGWLMRCTRRACWLTNKIPGFMVEQDIWSPDELDSNPIYRDFLRPRGLGWSAGTAIRMPTGDNLVVSIERAYERGPIEPEHVGQLNELLPHIGRSAFVAARLNLERAAGTTDALAALGLPAVVIDHAGCVLVANALCDHLVDALQWQAAGTIKFADRAAQELFDNACSSLDAVLKPALSFPMRDVMGKASNIAHLVPIRRSGRDIFANSAALLVVTPIVPPGVPPIELMRSLFDLTPAEARLARALASGKTLREAAAIVGVTHNTVRTQLRAILDKVGCKRQSELVALIGNLALKRGAGRE